MKLFGIITVHCLSYCIFMCHKILEFSVLLTPISISVSFFNHMILFEEEYEFQQKHIRCCARGYVMYWVEWLIQLSVKGTVRIHMSCLLCV